MSSTLQLGDPVILVVGSGRAECAARIVQIREILPGEWRVWAKVYAVPESGPVVNVQGSERTPRQLLGLVLCAYLEFFCDGKQANSGVARFNA